MGWEGTARTGTGAGSQQVKEFSRRGATSKSGLWEHPLSHPPPHQKVDTFVSASQQLPDTTSSRFCYPPVCLLLQTAPSLYGGLSTPWLWQYWALYPLSPTGRELFSCWRRFVYAVVANQHPSESKEAVAFCGGKQWEEEQMCRRRNSSHVLTSMHHRVLPQRLPLCQESCTWLV